MPPKHNEGLLSPWSEFFGELDALLPEPIQLHCIGGFVVRFRFGLARPTGDIDYVSAVPSNRIRDLQALAGPGSALAKKHKIYLQHVAVNAMPEDYEGRLEEMFPRHFERLRIYATDPYDLILSKLERNSPKDREDVEYLAKTLHLDPKVLSHRYQRELRSNLSNQSRHDQTFELWLSYFQEG